MDTSYFLHWKVYIYIIFTLNLYYTYIYIESWILFQLVSYILKLICEFSDFEGICLLLFWRVTCFLESSGVVKWAAGTFVLEMRLINSKTFPQFLNIWLFPEHVFIIVISSITFVVNREPNIPLWKLEKIPFDFSDFNEISPKNPLKGI